MEAKFRLVVHGANQQQTCARLPVRPALLRVFITPPPCVPALRCNEECAAGSYGQDCKSVCDCANGARCYNIDGGCLCEPGFSGPHCRDRMCAPGKYGMHCERTCLCQDKHTLR